MFREMDFETKRATCAVGIRKRKRVKSRVKARLYVCRCVYRRIITRDLTQGTRMFTRVFTQYTRTITRVFTQSIRVVTRDTETFFAFIKL